MTRYRSHPSPPWPGARKPRAVAPRTAHDYNLLAATVACWGVPPGMISRQLGFEEDYAERLLRSGPGRAFTEWLRQQPEEFVKRFQVNLESQAESGTQTGKGPAPRPNPPTRPPSAEEAFAKFYSDPTEDE